MGRAENARYRGLAWLLVVALPFAAQAGTDKAAGQEAKPIPDPAMLEFLAEEPDVGDGLDDALMTDDLDRAMDRVSDQGKVKDDENVAH